MNIYFGERGTSRTIKRWLCGSICGLGCAVFAAVALGSEADDPAKLYSAIKKTVQETMQKEQMHLGFAVYPNEPNERDLYFCFDAGTELGIFSSSSRYWGSTIALHLEVFKAELDALKVPRAVSAKSFAAMEAFGMATLKDEVPKTHDEWSAYQDKRRAEYENLLQGFAKDLNAYAATKTGMPHFHVEGGCGAEGQEVTVKTTPPGGTVSYIPMFSFKVCEATHVDPNDPEKCDGWITAVNATESMVGKYKYTATWPDGKKKTGTLNVTGKSKIDIAQ
jgi:hypothetical protein